MRRDTMDQTPVANWHRHEIALWALRLSSGDVTLQVSDTGAATVTKGDFQWDFDLTGVTP